MFDLAETRSFFRGVTPNMGNGTNVIALENAICKNLRRASKVFIGVISEDLTSQFFLRVSHEHPQ